MKKLTQKEKVILNDLSQLAKLISDHSFDTMKHIREIPLPELNENTKSVFNENNLTL